MRPMGASGDAPSWQSTEGDFLIDNLLVQTHFIIVMIRWTGLAPWRFISARQTETSYSILLLNGEYCSTNCSDLLIRIQTRQCS